MSYMYDGRADEKTKRETFKAKERSTMGNVLREMQQQTWLRFLRGERQTKLTNRD